MNATAEKDWYTERLPDGRTALFRGQRPKHPPGKYPRASQARWDFDNLCTLSTRVSRVTAARFRKLCERQDTTAYMALREFVEKSVQNHPPRNGGR